MTWIACQYNYEYTIILQLEIILKNTFATSSYYSLLFENNIGLNIER